MSDYFQSVRGQNLDTLKSNKDFQKDLITFFAGGRYNMTSDEIKKVGVDGLYEKYLEHMRYQESNEATAFKDLYYVRDTENVPGQELESFSRLIQAWDNSESAGDSFTSKAGDYLEAIITSPSTVAGLAAGGIGAPLSKLGTKAATKGAQIAVRKAITDKVASMVASNAAKKGVVSSVLTGAAKEAIPTAIVRGGLQGAAVEGAIGLAQEEATTQIREETNAQYQRDLQTYWMSVGLSAVTGGIGGSIGRTFDVAKQNKALDILEKHHKMKLVERAASSKTADQVLGSDSPNKDQVLDNLVEYLVGRDTKNLNPLDSDKVSLGVKIKEDILKGEGVYGGLNADAIKRVAAAGIEISDSLKAQPFERISSVLARGLETGEVTADEILSIRNKYSLTKEEFSQLYLAEMSEAGRKLATASNISKKMKKAEIDKIVSNVTSLGQRGIPSFDEDTLASLSRELDKDGWTVGNFLREIDATRIGFLTSQPATTAANLASSTARLGVDATDTFFKNLITNPTRNPFRGVLSGIKGVSWSKDQSEVLRIMMEEDAPESAKYIFKNVTRVENATEGQSVLAKFTRVMNLANTMTDTIFKEGIFFASVDRQLIELNNPQLGRNFAEFSKLHGSVEALPEEFLKKAKEDALGYVYQKSYTGDQTMFGKTAQLVMKAHKDVPFTVSMAIPFPRYIANQLEFLHDYTPIVGAITAAREAKDAALLSQKTGATFSQAAKAVRKDPTKTLSERLARQMTGTMMLVSAYYARSTQEGETEPLEFRSVDGTTASSERVGGPYNTYLVLADTFYRWKNGLPVPKLNDTAKELLQTAAGVGFVGYSESMPLEVLKSVSEGQWSDALNKQFGDLAATFTYPVVLAKDIAGQVYPSKSDKPYTRDVFGVDLFDSIGLRAEAANRAMRFTLDLDSIQYLQSFNGQNDIKMYSPFNPQPVRTINPALKQLTGVATNPALTDLQIELRRLGMKEWSTYTNRTTENPATDVLVRKRLAGRLSKDFREWRDQVKLNSITDLDARKVVLDNWLSQQFKDEEDMVNNAFLELQKVNPKLVAGFTRNQYRLKEKESALGYDSTVQLYTQGQYKSAEEYYSDTDSLTEELSRRLQIMSWDQSRNNGAVQN